MRLLPVGLVCLGLCAWILPFLDGRTLASAYGECHSGTGEFAQMFVRGLAQDCANVDTVMPAARILVITGAAWLAWRAARTIASRH